MKILFFFLDGVGIGPDNPDQNPFSASDLPNLNNLLGGKRMVTASLENGSLISRRATLISLDACLGIEGLPQSATGQATLLTGKNIPAILGYHYGPKPNKEIQTFISNGNLLSTLKNQNCRVALLNAYPPRYFKSIQNGYRLPGVIAMAFMKAGIPLRTIDDLNRGNALSADFTGKGWRDYLGFKETPLLSPYQAGVRLTGLTNNHDLSFFEYWPSDVAGHRQNMTTGVDILETFDQVLGGLLNSWDDESGLILITSDHGNIEDLDTRRHTTNPVPAIIIGNPHARKSFSTSLNDLTSILPAIIKILG